MRTESARFKGWIVTYVSGDHTLARDGDHRSRLFTFRHTFSVLPATLAVTNNDRHRSEMNFTSRSVDIHLQTAISIIGSNEFLSLNLYRSL
ncbi:hypothetical protein [Geomicrobium sp. JCM 19037]|uniref:hypothetical protein n=1 Tax=Geomicrobium sp. JCM 19037 TaxID=1460634 RepID=UPI001267F719|nr:hypothetical protein [Geomicrobium sp. JCM 19037]